MTLLQSLCCLFRGCSGEPEPRTSPKRNEASGQADLGQKEADLEKTSKEQMGHMEGDEAPANRQP